NRKSKLKKQVEFEHLGLQFIFLTIFSSGARTISDGIIHGGLEYIFRLLLGIWYFVVSLFLLITGIMLLIKRRYPDFTHKKMIGFYIIFFGVLLFTHMQTFEGLLVLEDASIIKTTWQ